MNASCMENPAVPCAMTGACAVLSGISGISVVIHGASGCYYYPKSLLKTPVYSTLLTEPEIVMGTVSRLRETVSQLNRTGTTVAVINTCVPALTGEDLSGAFDAETPALFVDAPGFLGAADAGVKAAYASLDIRVNPEKPGINIDGILTGLDLYARGNLHESQRLLGLMGIPCGLQLASDRLENIRSGAAPYTVSANPSWNADIGTPLGSLLFPDLETTLKNLASAMPYADTDTVFRELETADEKLMYYADKYLRKYTPPTVAVVSQKSYCTFAETMLRRYFGSDILLSIPRETQADAAAVETLLRDASPDLLLGSSFEYAAFGANPPAFAGITYPDRTRISISSRPMTGIEGATAFMEQCLNALMDVQKR